MRRSLRNRRRERAHRQRGAVLVEGVMVGAALVAIMACLFVIQRFCLLQIQMLDQARQQAWARSMAGCGGNDTNVNDIASQIKADDGPSMPFTLIPSGMSESRSFQVTGGPFSPSGSREIKFICNPRPVHTKPLSDMVGWLGDMFS